MKFHHLLKFSLLLLLLASGCTTPSTPTPSLTGTELPPSRTPLPTHTLSPTMTLSLTATLTPTSTLIPSLTSYPTMSSEEAGVLVLELLTTNGGCQLPCWWGLTPGETEWQTAEEFLTPFTTLIEQGDERTFNEGGQSIIETSYRVHYRVPGKDEEGQTEFIVRNGIISSISVNAVGTDLSYQLHQILSEYGKPTEIFMDFVLVSGPNIFTLGLHYSDSDMFVIYSGRVEYLETDVPDFYTLVCPQNIGPSLELWSPDVELTERDIQKFMDDDTLKPLWEFVLYPEMGIESFYWTFIDPDATDCIRVPAS